jgi:hypothetical protein
MKTNFVKLTLLLGSFFFSIASQAQTTSKKFSFGLKAGVNFSRVQNLEYQGYQGELNGKPSFDHFQNNNSQTTGVVGGIFARFGNRFYFQPELLLSVKGGGFDVFRQGNKIESIDMKVGTLNVPLLLGYRFGPVRINAGPMLSSTLLKGRVKSATSQATAYVIDETFNKNKLGFQAGVGVTFSRINIDLRREGDMTGLISGISMAPTDGAAGSLGIWQFTAGFEF